MLLKVLGSAEVLVLELSLCLTLMTSRGWISGILRSWPGLGAAGVVGGEEGMHSCRDADAGDDGVQGGTALTHLPVATIRLAMPSSAAA